MTWGVTIVVQLYFLLELSILSCRNNTPGCNRTSKDLGILRKWVVLVAVPSVESTTTTQQLHITFYTDTNAMRKIIATTTKTRRTTRTMLGGTDHAPSSSSGMHKNNLVQDCWYDWSSVPVFHTKACVFQHCHKSILPRNPISSREIPLPTILQRDFVVVTRGVCRLEEIGSC